MNNFWLNDRCDCLSCENYRIQLQHVSDECDELEADYFWDETWDFINNLRDKINP